jgi:hypothetical protein
MVTAFGGGAAAAATVLRDWIENPAAAEIGSTVIGDAQHG